MKKLTAKPGLHLYAFPVHQLSPFGLKSPSTRSESERYGRNPRGCSHHNGARAAPCRSKGHQCTNLFAFASATFASEEHPHGIGLGDSSSLTLWYFGFAVLLIYGSKDLLLPAPGLQQSLSPDGER